MSRTRIRQWGGGQVLVGQTKLGSTWEPAYRPGNSHYEKCVDSTNPGPPYRRGGPLVIEKVTTTYRESIHVFGSQTFGLKPGIDSKCYSVAPSVAVPTRKDPSSWGAIGWNRTVPTDPVLSLGNFIVELKDIPHMLETSRKLMKSFGKDGLMNPGAHYLNYQFGWKLLIKDLIDILDVQKALDDKIRQLRRDNGKPVRRACKLSVKETFRRVSTSAPGASNLGPSVSSNVRVTAPCMDITDERYQQNIWFAARYRYWIPELAEPRADLRLLKAKLLGLLPTPDVIYNAVPWTWLLDWFTNVGPVLENMVNTAEYHVVADYAYVMAHESYSYLRKGSGVYGTGTFSTSSPNPVTVWASTQRKYEWKTRVAAHPYGFGITDASLTGYQWSILGALGLTRLR